ncbi:bifunctional UDP-sugar hydrolase/5'-nucleotidase [Neobacillus mesonae]|uniref:bifunctional metallophosphatase/5'-nucleotidase n=1 Tax=Neobacillus mesonae TaxID=1193713 RepID=UPI00203D1F46|nr:bifunctional metallophosphatase/5'-nucleotidase [Neobacillus mesonae]MCM3568118.1 bifunctional metallophosphatase/5'-nucleotidase [Neobacillus mesonae]
MGGKRHLTILQMNDTHAYLNLHPEMFIKEKGEVHFRNAGGFSRITTIFKEARAQNPGGVLILDNGDTFHGTYPAVSSNGESLIPILNKMGIDGMTAHWEFAYGPNHLKKLTAALEYPMLANNCYDKKSKQPIFPTDMVIERAGLKIGVIGIACHIVDKTMPSHFSTGVSFTLGNEELLTQIDKLRKVNHVDLIVVLSHLGFPIEAKIAAEVDGIDILLSAHTHNRLYEPVLINNTLIIQSGCHGSFIGRLDLEIENRQILTFRHKLIEVSESIQPDPQVQALINYILEPHRAMLQSKVGETKTALHRYAQLETTMDNLLLQSLIEISNAEIAFSNGWRYGAPIPPGPITMNDLWNIIPTNPPVSTVELTGKEILEMLEENLERTFAGNPYHQMGGYMKRCFGLRMFIKIENPAGTRIQQLFINDQLVDINQTYLASFVTMQGVPQKYGSNRRNLNAHAIDALKQFIEKRGVISIQLNDIVQVV